MDPLEFSVVITVQYYFFSVGGHKFKKNVLKKEKVQLISSQTTADTDKSASNLEFCF